eukprot:86732_1
MSCIIFTFNTLKGIIATSRNLRFTARLRRRITHTHLLPHPFPNRFNQVGFNILHAARKSTQNKICISIFGVGISFGCYNILFSNRKHVITAANSSKFSDQEWNEFAHEINTFGHNLRKSVQIHWYEYVAVIASIVCGGIGLLLWPLWKWYFVKRSIKNLKIGRLRCRLTGSFRSYLWDVVAHYILFTTITLGIYPLFGFGFIHESYWFDSHTVWYVPQHQKQSNGLITVAVQGSD